MPNSIYRLYSGFKCAVSKMAFIMCSACSYSVFWPDLVQGKLNPANSSGFNFSQNTNNAREARL